MRSIQTLLVFGFFAVCGLACHQQRTITLSDRSARDVWLKTLTEGEPRKEGPDLSDENRIVEAFQKNEKSEDPKGKENFSKNVIEQLGFHYSTSTDYSELARVLFRARDRIRLLGAIEKTKSALTVLDNLIDETLYAMSILFPEDSARMKNWKIDFPVRTCESRYNHAGNYFGFGLCPGDVVLTKNEAFSSSLFAFRSPESGTFSHASIPYFPPAPAEVLLIQAEPMGDLFEDPRHEDQPVKTAVYRFVGPNAEAQSLKVNDEVNKTVQIRAKKSAFNFFLDPQCEPGRYFCTEVVYCAYKQSGLDATLNPYAEKLWSPTSKDAPEFIEKISRSRWDPIPMPGDVEQSSAFAPLGYVVRLDYLPALRVREAVVKSFASLMHTDTDLRARYLSALDRFGEKTIGDLHKGSQELSFLDSLGVTNGDKVTPLQKSLPPNTRLKEIAFYFHFQNYMLSKISGKLIDASKTQPSSAIAMGELEKRATPELRSGTEAFIALLSSFQGL